jgi:pyrophosphatase PpaX
VEAVLLDMDGTLILAPHDWAEIRRRLGVGPGSILDQLHALPEPERSDRLAELDSMETAACSSARPAPGAEELLALLHRLGLRTALVTNNSRKSVEAVLRRTGWRFDAVLTRDDGCWKPSPEPLLEAAHRLSVPIERCAALGDAWLDLEAARAAGCRSIWLVDPAASSHGQAADLAAPGLLGILAALDGTGAARGTMPTTTPDERNEP